LIGAGSYSTISHTDIVIIIIIIIIILPSFPRVPPKVPDLPGLNLLHDDRGAAIASLWPRHGAHAVMAPGRRHGSAMAALAVAANINKILVRVTLG
jgi:hypothetical protein